MSSLGWLTESTLIPQKSKKIQVDQNSLVDLQVAMIQKKEQNKSGTSFQAKTSRKTQKYEEMINKKNKNIELRNQKDIQAIKDENTIKHTLNSKQSIYDKLQKKGHNIEKLLVDFQQKKIDNMTTEEQNEYERERDRFYESKKQEIQEKQEQILNGQQKIELNKEQNNEEKERLEWEKEVLQELEDGLDEKDILDQTNQQRPLVMQVYDNVASKEQKIKYDEFIKEDQQEKSKLELIKQRKQQQIDQRKQKIEALKNRANINKNQN